MLLIFLVFFKFVFSRVVIKTSFHFSIFKKYQFLFTKLVTRCLSVQQLLAATRHSPIISFFLLLCFQLLIFFFVKSFFVYLLWLTVFTEDVSEAVSSSLIKFWPRWSPPPTLPPRTLDEAANSPASPDPETRPQEIEEILSPPILPALELRPSDGTPN